MARGGRGGQPTRRPVDMTGVISIAERNDLATLMNAITEKLHNNISVVFDSPPVTPVLGELGNNTWLSLSPQSGKENIDPNVPSQLKRPLENSKPYSKPSLSNDNDDDESITPQLQELRKEALVFFRKWQACILQRLRDMNVNEANIPPTNFRGRGRANFRGARGARAGRGGRGGNRGGLTLAAGKYE